MGGGGGGRKETSSTTSPKPKLIGGILKTGALREAHLFRDHGWRCRHTDDTRATCDGSDDKKDAELGMMHPRNLPHVTNVDDAKSVAVDREVTKVTRYQASPRQLAMDACIAKFVFANRRDKETWTQIWEDANA